MFDVLLTQVAQHTMGLGHILRGIRSCLLGRAGAGLESSGAMGITSSHLRLLTAVEEKPRGFNLRG